MEGHLYKVISRTDAIPETILMIAEHPNWSNRPLIRFSLTRNAHTPLSLSVRFLQSMKLVDLRELYGDPSLPLAIRPFVYRELLKRGKDPEHVGEEQIYEIKEEEIEALDAAVTMHELDNPDEESAPEEQE